MPSTWAKKAVKKMTKGKVLHVNDLLRRETRSEAFRLAHQMGENAVIVNGSAHRHVKVPNGVSQRETSVKFEEDEANYVTRSTQFQFPHAGKLVLPERKQNRKKYTKAVFTNFNNREAKIILTPWMKGSEGNSPVAT